MLQDERHFTVFVEKAPRSLALSSLWGAILSLLFQPPLPAPAAYFQMYLLVIKQFHVPVRKNRSMERRPIQTSERYLLVSISEAYRSQFSVGLT